MQQGSVHVAPFLRWSGDLALWNEHEIVRPSPTLQEILERFTDYRLEMRA